MGFLSIRKKANIFFKTCTPNNVGVTLHFLQAHTLLCNLSSFKNANREMFSLASNDLKLNL